MAKIGFVKVARNLTLGEKTVPSKSQGLSRALLKLKIRYVLDPCVQWPDNYFERYDEPNETLVNELHEYGKQNLALVHVMIQSPYVTKIKRDVAMTLTTYIANAGGLLGLCIGFSFISAIEIFFWFCCYCRNVKK